MIADHLPLARHIASRYARDDRHDDYVQEAAIGLVQASKGYDPTRGIPFGAYARQWLVTRCQRYKRADHTIALPRCAEATGEIPTCVWGDDDLAHGEENNPEEALSERQEQAALVAWIALALAKLTDRERMAVEGYHLRGETQTEIGKALGVNRNIVRQTIERAMEKMRKMGPWR